MYRAYEDDEVIFDGGISFSSSVLRPVVDTEILNRIPENARDKVKCVKLSEIGIDVATLGSMEARGSGANNLKKYYPDVTVIPFSNLVCDGELMTIARWPNEDEGYTAVGKVIETGTVVEENSDIKTSQLKGAVFTAPEDKAALWQNAKDAWVYGLWEYEWDDLSVPVESVSVEDNSIKTLYPLFSNIKEGNKYYIYNLIEELDQEGEWYIGDGILYFYPPEKASEITISNFQDPLIYMSNCENITFSGIHFRNSRVRGIYAEGCKNIDLINCKFSNISTIGAHINNAYNCDIKNCEFYDMGAMAISISGGDFNTLTPGENTVSCCDIHDFGLINKMYQPGVYVSGVGNKISHNEIYDSPHSAILIAGNDNLIEYNDIHNCLRETNDAGAIYTGRSWIRRGNVISNNYIHDLVGNDTNGSVHGVYLDTFYCGTTIKSNIFENITGDYSSGILCGGRDTVIEDNIFINSTRMIKMIGLGGLDNNYDRALAAWTGTEIYGIFSDVFKNNKAVYVEKYSESILDYKDVGEGSSLEDLKYNFTSDGSIMKNNVLYNSDDFVLIHSAGDLTEAQNLDELKWSWETPWSTNVDPGFEDAENKIYTLKETSEIYDHYPDFEAPDFENILRGE